MLRNSDGNEEKNVRIQNQSTGEIKQTVCGGTTFALSGSGSDTFKVLTTLGTDCATSATANEFDAGTHSIGPAGGTITLGPPALTVDSLFCTDIVTGHFLSGVPLTNTTSGDAQPSGCNVRILKHSGPAGNNNTFAWPAGTYQDCTTNQLIAYQSGSRSAHGAITIQLTPA